ncbi:MAG TPA: biopolymer transporter ExbD [Candidatus Omnitrophota bacterium]|nr:biopolymer transporter ExbD [Candidatus Omnitrophota bacterium]HPS19472.1 biopolymer transporter ExbD [Candidatus Omnitrophota bacterium]
MNLSGSKGPVFERPILQIIPMIDVVMFLLIFFMTMSVFYAMEAEINISVPTAAESTEMGRAPGEVIINVRRDGVVIVNQRQVDYETLQDILKKVSEIYKNQPVVIRGDKKTHHEDIVKVLDACAAANMWNISFATMKEKE